jgi:hypothetical protein
VKGQVGELHLDREPSSRCRYISARSLAWWAPVEKNVDRALSRFGSLGLLKVERGRITLLRPEELRRRAV